MSKKWHFIILLFCAIGLTGCGFKDIDKRFFVVSIGVDKAEDNQWNVSLKLAIPSSDPASKGGESVVLSGKADSISDAIRIMKSEVDKELDFGHAKTIIFGEKIMKGDISNVLDWFVRRRDIQQIAWMAVGTPTAKEILEFQPKQEQIPSNTLFLSFGEEGTETPYILSNYLFSLRSYYEERGKDQSLPIIGIKEDTLEINRGFVFDQDQHYIETSHNETLLLNMLYNTIQKSELNVENDKYNFTVISTKPKVHYQIHIPKSKKPYVDVHIKITGNLDESHSKTSKRELSKYAELVNKQLEKQMKGLLVKLQKKSLDPIGFGLRYRATHIGNEELKINHWKSIYPDIQFRVHVDTTIEGSGVIK